MTGEAIVIDPARNITPYLEVAEKEGLRITATAETHIHADFVSGTQEFAKRTTRRLICQMKRRQLEISIRLGYSLCPCKDGDRSK